MSGISDKIVGRAKEAAGAITDDDKLRSEGKADQMVGQAKDLAEKAIDKVKEVAGKVSDKVQDIAHKATDKR